MRNERAWPQQSREPQLSREQPLPFGSRLRIRLGSLPTLSFLSNKVLNIRVEVKMGDKTLKKDFGPAVPHIQVDYGRVLSCFP